MFNQDSETLRASISSPQVSIAALNSELLRDTGGYSWYWQQAPQFQVDLKRDAVLELNCEDCQNDLWLATRQLYRLSITFAALDIHIWIEAQEANFLLIEAANYLEQWYDDFDERNSSVFVSCGEFFIFPNGSPAKIRLNSKAQQCLVHRMNSVHLESVEMNLVCPVRMAASLDAHPWLLTHIAHEYLDMDARAGKQNEERMVTVRIRMNRLLFAKLNWRSRQKTQEALVSAFNSLLGPGGQSRSIQYLKRFTDQSIEKPIPAVELATATQCELFLKRYRCPSPIKEPDLSWLEVGDLEYRTVDFSTVNSAINEFFAERGTRGAELPWQLGKDCRPLQVDGDRILEKLKSLNFSSDDDDEDSSVEEEREQKSENLLGMSDLLESAQGEHSPAKPLLSSLGVHIEKDT